LTQALRAELRGTGIEVVATYPGGLDTDMLAGVEADKAAPVVVAARIVDAIANGDQGLSLVDRARAHPRHRTGPQRSLGRCQSTC
jgi:NAD(P)-dependent dehydrogenase (short-subunit alcohol dehydrogenase family)